MIQLTELLRELAAKNEASCVAIVVAAARGAARPGGKAVFDEHGKRRGGDALFSEELDAAVGKRAAKVIATGEPALVELDDASCGARLQLYLEPQGTSGEILVLGKGPVAQAVAKVGEACGFRVRAVDSGYAKVDPPGPRTHVVVATGHEADEEALAAALEGEPASVQLVASSRRAPGVMAALKKAGIADSKVATVRSPAGLDLGGDSPGEIALSIVAEIQALRKGGTLKPLSQARGKTTSTTKRAPVLPPPPPAPRPKAAPARATRKHKVKFAMEDDEEPRFPTRHDEDFRPDDEPPKPMSERPTSKLKKRK